MTSHQSSQPTTTEAPGPDDPRYTFAQVVDAVGTLIEATTPEMLSNPTPCPDFTVEGLLEHMVVVVRRLAALGRGEAWTAVEETVSGDDTWANHYRAAAHDVSLSWADPAILETMITAPWAELPGAALLHSIAGELAVHGWDVAQATGLDLRIDDTALAGALVAAKFIPAEGRDAPDMPFAAVVDPGPDAPALDQLAGWMGRQVV